MQSHFSKDHFNMQHGFMTSEMYKKSSSSESCKCVLINTAYVHTAKDLFKQMRKDSQLQDEIKFLYHANVREVQD